MRQTELFPSGRIAPNWKGFISDVEQVLSGFYPAEDAATLLSMMVQISGSCKSQRFCDAISLTIDSLHLMPVIRKTIAEFSGGGITERQKHLNQLRIANQRALDSYLKRPSDETTMRDLIWLLASAKHGVVPASISSKEARASGNKLANTINALQKMQAGLDMADDFYAIIKSLPKNGHIEAHLILISALVIWESLTDDPPKVEVFIYGDNAKEKYTGQFVDFHELYQKASCFHGPSYTLATLDRKLSVANYQKLIPVIKQFNHVLLSMDDIIVMPMLRS